MATVVITIKIMPKSPESDLAQVEKVATESIAKFGGSVGKKEIEPVAFGLKSLSLYFTMDESKGSTEPLEKALLEIPEVQSAEVVDVRRTIG